MECSIIPRFHTDSLGENSLIATFDTKHLKRLLGKTKFSKIRKTRKNFEF